MNDREKIDRCAVTYHPCNCIGPQNGQPLCPCKMRGVVVKNGRYVIPEQDLGPVRVSEHITRDKDPDDWIRIHMGGDW